MITRDEWLSAFTEAAAAPIPSDPDVMTVRECMEAFGIGEKGARAKLDLLVKAGKAQRTTKIRRNSIGVAVAVPAYRLLKKKKR
jgi:alpha-beta hydrolase superfamily lysophospholipase